MRSRRLLLLLLLTAALLVASAAPALAAHRAVTASSGDVSAQLAYDTNGQPGDAANVKLSIIRAGNELVAGLIPACGEGCAITPLQIGNPLTVRDLDGDGEPEVLVDLFTGGAHCCFWTLAYHYDAATGSYLRTVRDWGDPGYSLRDLDRDGKPEFVTADDVFAYAFGAFADSAMPIEILQFRSGRFVRVTAHFRHAVAHDAGVTYRIYRRVRATSEAVRGVLPAYAADEAMLGRWAHADAVLHRAARQGQLGRGPLGYIGSVKRFLRHHGYLR